MANQTMADMFGYDSVEEFCKIPVSQVYAAPSRRISQANELIEKGRFERKETHFKRKNGKYFWGSVTAQSILENGKVQYFDGIVEDITEFKVEFENLIDDLHTAVAAADELLKCTDLDFLYKRSVELAREKLKVERCGMYIKTGDNWQGTFGTDSLGNTTNESDGPLNNPNIIRSFLNAVEIGESPHWRKFSDWMLTEWDPILKKHKDFKKGWLVMTAIRMPPSQNIEGIFFNDTAITEKEMDATQQEILAVYCSLLGSLTAAKREESKRKKIDHRTIDHWKFAVTEAIRKQCEKCPNFTEIGNDIKDAIERIHELLPIEETLKKN